MGRSATRGPFRDGWGLLVLPIASLDGLVRHTLHLYLDDVAPALSAAAELLDSGSIRLESLEFSAGSPLGRARLTAVVEAPDGAPGLERFRRLAFRIDPKAKPAGLPARPDAVPYHWQADGAGDHRVG